MMLSDPPPRVKTSGSARAGSSTEARCQLTSQREAPHCQRLFSEPPSREVSSRRSQKWLHPPCQTDRIGRGKEGIGAPSREAIVSMIGDHWKHTACSEISCMGWWWIWKRGHPVADNPVKLPESLWALCRRKQLWTYLKGRGYPICEWLITSLPAFSGSFRTTVIAGLPGAQQHWRKVAEEDSKHLNVHRTLSPAALRIRPYMSLAYEVWSCHAMNAIPKTCC